MCTTLKSFPKHHHFSPRTNVTVEAYNGGSKKFVSDLGDATRMKTFEEEWRRLKGDPQDGVKRAEDRARSPRKSA